MGKYTKITNEIKEKIIELYNSGLTIGEVAKKLMIGYVTTKKYLDLSNKRNRNFTKRKSIYPINDKFFERIDSHQKAQLLGLIYADGCLIENGGRKTSAQTCKSWVLSVGLQETDCEFVKQIKNITQSSAPIHFIKSRIHNKPEHKVHIKNRQNTYLWSTCNYKLCTDIQKLGIHPRKSLTCIFPNNHQVPDEFINSFMLGCYEGDGSFVFVESRFEATFSLIGNDEFITAMKNKIIDLYGIYSSVVVYKRTPGMSTLSIAGNKQVIRFMDILYKNSDSSFRMTRKYDKYINFKKMYLEKLDKMNSDDWKQEITEKRNETRKKFNRTNTFNFFYIKSPDNKIYFSNKLCDFYKKYNLTPYRAGFLINGKINNYKGWTIPSEEEIIIAKYNNFIINEIFEKKQLETRKYLTNFYLKNKESDYSSE